MKENYTPFAKRQSFAEKLTGSWRLPSGKLRLSKNKYVLSVAFLLLGLMPTLAQTTAISPTGDGGFETGTTLALNGWTAVQPGNSRQWQVGTAAGVQAGTNAAYIGSTTNNNGTNSTSVQHFYKDIAIPTGATVVKLNYYLKETTADDGYDYFYVFTTSTSNTPVSGTVPGTGYTQKFVNTTTAYSAFTAMSAIDLTSYAGSTVRIIFSFKSDGVSPHANPALDGISLTYTAPTTPYVSASSLSAAFGNVCLNTASAASSFTITGGNLTGDVIIGALTGYTYSTTSGGTYTSTLTLSPSSGSLSQTVYVKLTPTVTTAGAYNGNIPVTGGGTSTTATVAVTGAGVNTAPTISAGGTAGSFTTTDATISTSTVSSAGCTAITAYGIEYSLTSGFTAGTGTQIAGTGLTAGAAGSFSTSLSGLNANTTYYYRAYATNSGGTTYYPSTPASFTTLQVPATLNFTENFEGTSNWTIVNGSYTNKWFIGTATNNGGTKSLYISNNASGTTNNYSLTSSSYVQAYRDITVPAGTGNVEFSFDWKAYGEGTTTLYDYLKVWLVPSTYFPSGQITAGTGRIAVGTYNLQTNFTTYSNPTLNVSSFAGQTMRLVFEWNNDGSGGTQPPAAIDNISMQIPACSAPSALVASAIATTTAAISWTAASTAPGTSYEYYYSTSNTTPTTTTSGDVGPTVVTKTLTGLQANTTYYAWVRSSCDATNKSAWVGPVTIKTDCDAVTTFPFTENFEAPTAPATPDCWTVIDANNDGDKWITYSDATYAHGGTKSVGLYTDFNAGANNDWLITPGLTLSGNQRLRFWVRARSTGEPNDYMVKLSTTGKATTDFTTTLQALTTVSNTTYQEVIINLTAYTGTVYIAFNVPSGGLDGYYLYIDDVSVENMPECQSVTAPVSTLTSLTSATISWTAPAVVPATGYEYYYSTTNTAPLATATVVTANVATATSVPLTGLTSSTNYYWWVRSVCSTTLSSEWTSGGSFYTGYCITVPGTVNAVDIVTNVVVNSTYGTTFTNTSTSNGTDNYTSYSNTPIVLYQGAAGNTIAITFGTDGTQYSAAWIDYNQNLVFDSGEALGVATTAAAGSGTTTYTFTVPATATLGTTKLRVRGGADSAYTAAGACTSSSFGETEDYVVTIATAPTCLPVTALAVTAASVTPTTATVTWTAPTQGTPVSYSYEVRTTGTPGTDGAIIASSASSTSVPLTGLTQGVTYTVYVRSFCGGTDYSTWSSGVTFTTQGLAPVIWTEPITAASLPTSWTNNGFSYGTSTPIGTADGHGNYAYRAFTNTNNTFSFTTLNVGTLGTNDRLKFDFKFALTASPYDVVAAGAANFVVEISTDYGVTWATLETSLSTGAAGWKTYIHSLAAYSGQIVKLRITGNKLSGANFNLAFDNFVIEPTPACETPASPLAASAITANTATLTWGASSSAPAGGYEYYYSITNTTPTAGATPNGSVAAGVLTAAVTGLTANSTYYWWVRSVCDDSNKGNWAAGVSFTTSKAEPSNYATNLAVTAATGAAIDFSWTASVAGDQAPDGYVLTGSLTNPAATPADGTDSANANLAAASPLRKVTGATATTGTLNGGTAGTMYYFKNVPYTNSGTAINFKTDGTIPALNYATKPAAATIQTATGIATHQATLNWTLPATFDATRHQVLVFVKAATAITAGTPTIDPASYTASTDFTTPGTAYQGDAAAYNVYSGTGTSVTVAGLSTASVYYYGIAIVMKAANYNSTYTYSNASTSSFTTACEAITALPHEESFNAATLPSCWSTGGTGTWAPDDTSDGVPSPHTGAMFAGVQWNYSTNNAALLISPAYNLTAITQPIWVNVWVYRNTDGLSTDRTTFYVNTQANITGATQLLDIPLLTTQAPAVAEAGWYNYTVVVPASYVSGGTFYIVTKGTTTTSYDSYSVGIDDYKLELAPSCVPVSNVTAAIASATSVTASWTASVSNPASGYEYYYNTTGTAPTAATAPSGTTASTSATITGLTTDTTVYVWVRSHCSGSDYSLWTGTSVYLGYCTPSSDDYYDYISDFTTTGGAANITNSSTSSGTGYSNYTAQAVSANPGNSVSFTATMPNDTYGFAIWVDWNDDFTFSSSERVYVSSGFVSSATGSILVPSTAAAGNHRMRIMADYGSGTPADPCSVTYDDYYEDYYGEVEDYTFTVIVPCYTWTGAFNTVWTNTANWCGGVIPSATSDVTIAPTANNPVISTGLAHAHNLTVGQGATLTVAAGATLSVENILSVHPEGTLTISNNGALLQATTATANTNVGKITIHKNSNPLYRLDYTMWSSPVDGQNLALFSPATSTNRFYEYKYALNSSNEWIEGYWPVTPGTTNFAAAKGYLIRMPNSISTLTGYAEGTASSVLDGTFTGTPNNGTVNIDLSILHNRYTAVGNPYPSPISVSDFFAANSTKLYSATGLYLWRKRNNSASSSYATLTQAGYVANPDDATTSAANIGSFYQGAASTWMISQGQGFIVRTVGDNFTTAPQLTFTNSMRRAAQGTSQGFFKSAQSTDSKLWLNLTAESGSASQAMVAYMEAEGTPGLDYGYDGLKLTDGNTVALYSLAESTPLAIQARPGFNAGDVVPMGFAAPAAGQYTISLDHTEGVFSQGQAIYLRDNAEGIIRNMGTNDYSFTTEAGTFEGRFDVIYTTTALGTDNPVLDPNTVVVYKQGNTISINTGTAMMNGVTIFDIRGRQLYNAGGINATETTVSNLNIAQQVIIVEIDTVKGKVSKRIVF